MEMHQVRYFLAVTRTLNFTRAAEECNVAQPSLTRAVKLLEEELGGELFRRERNLTHLTDLGTRMLPLLQQCFDSAQSAKSLATSLKTGSIAPLSLALSRTIPIELLIPYLSEMVRAFTGLELKFLRGTGAEVGEALKKGDAEIAVAGPLGDGWERLDAWPLFTESYHLMLAAEHPLAGRNSVDLEQLGGERLLSRGYCEQAEQLAGILRLHGIEGSVRHTVANEADLVALLAANVGVAIAPRSAPLPPSGRRAHVNGLELTRTVHVYAVAGRQRSAAAATLLKALRAADWSKWAG
jgi:DNA-binding transcriptional LysR family regulator